MRCFEKKDTTIKQTNSKLHMTSLLNFECHRLASKHSSPSRKPFDSTTRQLHHRETISFLAGNYSTVSSKIHKNPLPTTHVVDVSYRNVSPSALFTGVKHLPTEYVLELNYKGNSLGGVGSEWSLPQFLDKVSCVFPNLQHLHVDHGNQQQHKQQQQQQHGYICQISSQEQEFYLRLYILFRMPDLKSINGRPVTTHEQKLARPSNPSGIPISLPENPADWIHMTDFSAGPFSKEKMHKKRSSPHSITANIIEPLVLCAKKEILLTFGEEGSEQTFLEYEEHSEQDSSTLPSSPPSLHKSKPAFTRKSMLMFQTLESRLEEVTVKNVTNENPTKEDSFESNDYSQDMRLHEQKSSFPQLAQGHQSDADMQQASHLNGSLKFIHPPNTRKKAVTFQDDIHGSKANMIDNALNEPQMYFFGKKDTIRLPFQHPPLPTISAVMRHKRDQWRKRQNFTKKKACPSESMLTLNCSSEEEEQQPYEC